MTPRTPDEINRVLTAFQKYWLAHRHRSLTQIVEDLTPQGYATNLRDERLVREINKRLGE